MTAAAYVATSEREAANVARAEQQVADYTAAGLALPAQLYALGTPVNSTGRRNFAAAREAWAMRPAFSTVCDSAVERIQREQRADVALPLSALRMRPTGEMERFAGVGAGDRWNVTETGFRGLLGGFGAASGTSYLLTCPPHLRAANVNYWAEAAGERGWTLRTRASLDERQLGQREIFAGVSAGYASFDADRLATVARQLVPVGARGELLYDGERFRLGASWFSDIAPADAVCGEVFRLYMFLSTRDDGRGSIRVLWGVERNLCLNLIILGRAEETLRVRHTAGSDGIEAAVRKAIGSAAAKVAPFAAAWSLARRTDLLEQVAGSKWSAADLFRGMLAEDHVRAPAGVTDEEMVQRLVAAWQREPGYSVADVANAVSRAAHEESWSSPWASQELEEQAGELLYARVYWTDVVEAGQQAQ